MPGQVTHHHHGTTVYAPPVTCRAPSPASSVGTSYAADATSFSDSEEQISNFAFARRIEENIKLFEPRPEEEWAEREVLVVEEGRGEGGAAEIALFEKIVRNLREEIKRLDEDELFERALLKGSQVELEPKPLTNDIDKLMRSIMGPALNINGPDSSAPMSRNTMIGDSVIHDPPGISNGPWNNFGKKPASFNLSNIKEVSEVDTASSLSSLPKTKTNVTTNGVADVHLVPPLKSLASVNHAPDTPSMVGAAGINNASGMPVVGSLKRRRKGGEPRQ